MDKSGMGDGMGMGGRNRGTGARGESKVEQRLTQYEDAVEDDDAESLLRILDESQKHIDDSVETGRRGYCTLLHVVAQSATLCPRCLDACLDRGADIDARIWHPQDGRTALMILAGQHGIKATGRPNLRLTMMKQLLRRGANPALIGKHATGGTVSLYTAANEAILKGQQFASRVTPEHDSIVALLSDVNEINAVRAEGRLPPLEANTKLKLSLWESTAQAGPFGGEICCALA